jgi:prevent-host-death family protein
MTSQNLLPPSEVQASEAKTHLLRLLDNVEQGESFVITRHGRAIARLVPENVQQQTDSARIVQALHALRASLANRGQSFSWNELKSYRDEGRR